MGIGYFYDPPDEGEASGDYPDEPDSDEWAACAECGDPTDDERGGPHAICGQFFCPGDCGRVISVPALACPKCMAWVAAEDEEWRRENAAILQPGCWEEPHPFGEHPDDDLCKVCRGVWHDPIHGSKPGSAERQGS